MLLYVSIKRIFIYKHGHRQDIFEGGQMPSSPPPAGTHADTRKTNGSAILAHFPYLLKEITCDAVVANSCSFFICTLFASTC
jgi:hypothetical protein